MLVKFSVFIEQMEKQRDSGINKELLLAHTQHRPVVYLKNNTSKIVHSDIRQTQACHFLQYTLCVFERDPSYDSSCDTHTCILLVIWARSGFFLH